MCSGSAPRWFVLAPLVGAIAVHLQRDYPVTGETLDTTHFEDLGSPPTVATPGLEFYDDADETPRVLWKDPDAADLPAANETMEISMKALRPDSPGDDMMKSTGRHIEILIDTTPMALTRSIPVGIDVLPTQQMYKQSLGGWKDGEAARPIRVVHTKTLSNVTVSRFTVKPTMLYDGRVMALGGRGHFLQHVKLVPETTFVAPGWFMHAKQIAEKPRNEGGFYDPIAGIDIIADIEWGSLLQIQKWHRRVHFNFRGDGQVSVKFPKPKELWDDRYVADGI